MDAPNVTGFLMSDAIQLLKNWNEKVEIIETETKCAKPKEEIGNELRVLNQKNNGNQIYLTVSYF